VSNYYVATTGSNAAAGTLAAPFLTITYAISVAANGDTIYVRGGTYSERVSLSKSLTISAYNGETAIIFAPVGAEGEGVSIINALDVRLTGITVDSTNRRKGVAITACDRVTLQGCIVKNAVSAVAGVYAHGIIVSNGSSSDVHIYDTIVFNIHGVLADETFCHAIYVNTPGTIIARCEMYNIGGHGIHWYAAQGGDLVAYDNYIHDTHTGIGVYQSTSLVYHNIMRNVAGLGLAVRYGVQNTLIVFNTVIGGGIGCDISALVDGAVVVVRNNVFHNGSFAIHAEQLVAAAVSVIANYNLRSVQTNADYAGAFASSWTISSINGTFTPVFDNGTTSIFPRNGSAALKAGLNIPTLTVDRSGRKRTNPPSIGAYEPRKMRLKI